MHGRRAKNQYTEPFKKKIGNGSHPCGSHLDLLWDAVVATVASLLLNKYLISAKPNNILDEQTETSASPRRALEDNEPLPCQQDGAISNKGIAPINI